MQNSFCMTTLETSSDCAQSALAYLAEAQDETTHLRPVGKQPRSKHADQCVIFLNLAMHSPQSLLAYLASMPLQPGHGVWEIGRFMRCLCVCGSNNLDEVSRDIPMPPVLQEYHILQYSTNLCVIESRRKCVRCSRSLPSAGKADILRSEWTSFIRKGTICPEAFSAKAIKGIAGTRIINSSLFVLNPDNCVYKLLFWSSNDQIVH